MVASLRRQRPFAGTRSSTPGSTACTSEGGGEAQCHMDTYLAAAAYFMHGARGESWAANMMVLGLPDAPQEGRLPDLGVIIRAVLAGTVRPASRPKGKGSEV